MEAPKLPSIFKQNQHKRFDFKPRFYDERKERLEEMKRKHSGGPREFKAADMKGHLSAQWRSNRSGSSSISSSIRLVVIAMGLFLLTYLILFS